jgi:hypothetical protein
MEKDAGDSAKSWSFPVPGRASWPFSIRIRFWDLLDAGDRVVSTDSGMMRSRESSVSSRLSWATLSWSGTDGNQLVTGESRPSSYNGVITSTYFFLTKKDLTYFPAKQFTRPMAAFALVPNSHPHPLTSNVMVLNKEGDLELYSVHDVPKRTTCSRRGDLGIALGTFKFFSGFKHDSGPEPWNTESDSRKPSLGEQEGWRAQRSTSRGRLKNVKVDRISGMIFLWSCILE